MCPVTYLDTEINHKNYVVTADLLSKSTRRAFVHEREPMLAELFVKMLQVKFSVFGFPPALPALP